MNLVKLQHNCTSMSCIDDALHHDMCYICCNNINFLVNCFTSSRYIFIGHFIVVNQSIIQRSLIQLFFLVVFLFSSQKYSFFLVSCANVICVAVLHEWKYLFVAFTKNPSDVTPFIPRFNWKLITWSSISLRTHRSLQQYPLGWLSSNRSRTWRWLATSPGLAQSESIMMLLKTNILTIDQNYMSTKWFNSFRSRFPALRPKWIVPRCPWLCLRQST